MDASVIWADLPALAHRFALALARIGPAAMLLPGIGEAEIPATVRAGLAAGTAIVLLPALPIVPPPPDAAGLAARIFAEILIGLWLGWLTRLAALALPLAGQYIAAVLGLANILNPDSELGPQNAALGRAFGLAAPALILATGAHRWALAGLAASYRAVPPGALPPVPDSVETIVAATAGCVAVAVRLAAPFIVAATAFHVATGLLARLVPRLQVYFAALPGQLLGGLALLALLIGPLVSSWSEALADAWRALPGD